MAGSTWKFRKWKIKWNPSKRKFKKHRRDRKSSYEAHMRYRRNRGKMKQALRKSRIKGRVQRKKNKAMGIYKKLSLARKRWKNLMKSDINMEMWTDSLLNEATMAPEIDIDPNDIDDMKYALRQIKRNVELGDDDGIDEEEFEQFIEDAMTVLDDFETIEELEDDDKETLADIISFIEEFAEEADLIKDMDKSAEEIEDESEE